MAKIEQCCVKVSRSSLLLPARRITRMSDEELVAAFKEVLQAKLPSSPAASAPEGPLSSLQQLPARIQGFRLQLPWQQAPPTADSGSASMLSKLLQTGGSGASEGPAAASSKSEASGASRLEARSSSILENTLASTSSEDAGSSRLGSSLSESLRGPQTSGSDRKRNSLPASNEAVQLDQPDGQSKAGPTSRQPEEQSDTSSNQAQPGEPFESLCSPVT